MMETSTLAAPNRTRQWVLISVVSILPGLATITVALRFYSRRFVSRVVGLDDWLMLLAWLLMCAFATLTSISIVHGVGLPGAYISFADMIIIAKITASHSFIYNITGYLIKMSILTSYLRFAAHRRLSRYVYGSMVVLTALYIAVTIVLAVECRPFKKLWDIFAPGKCLDFVKLYYATSSLYVVTDIWILLLPLPTLWSLSAPLSQKMGLVGIFLVGGVATLACVGRLATTPLLINSKDPVYDIVPVGICAYIELGLAIICGSVPALRPLFVKNRKSNRTTHLDYSSGTPTDQKAARAYKFYPAFR